MNLRKQFLDDNFAKKRYSGFGVIKSKVNSKLEINLNELNLPSEFSQYKNNDAKNINISSLLNSCFSSGNSDLCKLGLYYARNLLARKDLSDTDLIFISDLIDKDLISNLIHFIEFSNDNIFIVNNQLLPLFSKLIKFTSIYFLYSMKVYGV